MTHATWPANADVLVRAGRHWGWMMAFGIISLLAGVVVLAWPGPTLIVVAVLFGIQLVVTGIFRFVAAFASGLLSRTEAGGSSGGASSGAASAGGGGSAAGGLNGAGGGEGAGISRIGASAGNAPGLIGTAVGEISTGSPARGNDGPATLGSQTLQSPWQRLPNAFRPRRARNRVQKSGSHFAARLNAR